MWMRKWKSRERIRLVQGPWSENSSWNSRNNLFTTLTWSRACLSPAWPRFPGSQTTWDLGAGISHLCYYPTSIVSWPRSLLALELCNMCSFPCRVQLHLSSNKWEMLPKKCIVLDLWALPLGWWPWVNSSPVNLSQEPSCIIVRTSSSMPFLHLECSSISPQSPNSLWGLGQVPSTSEAASNPHLSATFSL